MGVPQPTVIIWKPRGPSLLGGSRTDGVPDSESRGTRFAMGRTEVEARDDVREDVTCAAVLLQDEHHPQSHRT